MALQKEISSKNIWKGANYKFNTASKHLDVKILSDFIVKAMNSSGYKFAVMDSSLEKGTKIKTFGFKIRESTSAWVAVGVCHKKVVASKNYGFNFSSIGHGAYMVSSNGGNWSHTKL